MVFNVFLFYWLGGNFVFHFLFTFVAIIPFLRMCYANEGICGRAGSKGSGKRVEHGAEKGWITSKK